MQDRESLIEELGRLEIALGEARGATAGFEGDLKRLNEGMVFSGREAAQLSAGLGSGLRRAFEGLVFDGAKLSDVLRGLGSAVSQAVYNTAMRPVTQAAGQGLGAMLNGVMSGIMPFADGAPFSQGRVMPFAEGGIVSGPVRFPMRGGVTGLMGEAGPEAILPLARGPDGRLGVQAGGGGARPVQVVMNVSTPDLPSFQRSQSQLAARMGRMLALGQRNG
ncbi:phage tail tape measure protein [Falsigemmobacter intermedius]|uniref:phage tail tape measure protein n=1 Tax=Falsigemmobacter intermedius TaxID=1553448 RepID=UPI003F0CD737